MGKILHKVAHWKFYTNECGTRLQSVCCKGLIFSLKQICSQKAFDTQFMLSGEAILKLKWKLYSYYHKERLGGKGSVEENMNEEQRCFQFQVWNKILWNGMNERSFHIFQNQTCYSFLSKFWNSFLAKWNEFNG